MRCNYLGMRFVIVLGFFIMVLSAFAKANYQSSTGGSIEPVDDLIESDPISLMEFSCFDVKKNSNAEQQGNDGWVGLAQCSDTFANQIQTQQRESEDTFEFPPNNQSCMMSQTFSDGISAADASQRIKRRFSYYAHAHSSRTLGSLDFVKNQELIESLIMSIGISEINPKVKGVQRCVSKKRASMGGKAKAKKHY